MIKPPQQWDQAAIQAEMKRRHGTMGEFFAAHGIQSDGARRVTRLRNPDRSPRYNRAIAEALGVPVWELWPHWFDEHGNPRKLEPDSNARKARESQKAAAAIVCPACGFRHPGPKT